jgi:hypothetical protein
MLHRNDSATPSKPSERDEAELEQEKLGSSPELPRRRINAEDREEYSLDEGLIDEMVAAQLLSEAVEASSRVDQAPSPELLPAQSNSIQVFMDEEDDGRDTAQDNDQEALAERSTNLPAPARGTKSITFAPTPLKPHRSAFAEDDNPPSATQMFLENLDDYFPSPSQEIRELLEDAEDLPSNTQIAQELNAGASGTEADDFVGIISTQDFILSSQDLLEITTPSRVLQPRVAESLPAQPQAAPKQKGRFSKRRRTISSMLHCTRASSQRNGRDNGGSLPRSHRDRPRGSWSVLCLLRRITGTRSLVPVKRSCWNCFSSLGMGVFRVCITWVWDSYRARRCIGLDCPSGWSVCISVY